MNTKAKTQVIQYKKQDVITIDSVTQDYEKIKVCAYVRVSSNSQEQRNSYASQLNTYSKTIKQEPTYKFVGIYADEGITGTESRKRSEFLRMIEDCRNGKIDRIIAKSISRFARNFVELLEVYRELNKIGVSIYFEQERLDTGKIKSELFLTILSSLAENESLSISQNQKMGGRQRMMNGTYIQASLPYGYEYDENKQPVIIKSQAVIVKRIFSEYLSGKGKDSIAQSLNDNGVLSPKSDKWNNVRVDYILTNKFYIGTAVWQKKYVTDTLPFTLKINKGEKDMYIAENHHVAIIDKNDFNLVQNILKERYVHNPKEPHMFSRILRCPYCNNALKRRKNKDGTYKWICRTRLEKATNCRTPIVQEQAIEKSIVHLLCNLAGNSKQIINSLLYDYKKILDFSTNQPHISDAYEEIRTLNEQAIVYAELKLMDAIDESLYQQEIGIIQTKIHNLNKQIRIFSKDSIVNDKILQLENLRNDIAELSIESPLTLELFEYIEHLYVNLDDTITIKFKNLFQVTGAILL